ncbi:hypothetical protein ACIBI9_52515 [Nonomuraea sp. NPDC050451]|uniref:hypothetical protein n=1 Tax=Nonomuraea sp. NPDC050451 TaxID=3364364 RepID=UPI003789E37A
MHTGVGQQVRDHLAQPRRVALDGDRLLGQFEPPARVQPGEQQQVGHQFAHPARLGVDAVERVPYPLGHRLGAAKRPHSPSSGTT